MLLLITCHSIPSIDPMRETVMLLVGGFDDTDHIANQSRSSSFLVMSYPADNPEELTRRLGSVDYRPVEP